MRSSATACKFSPFRDMSLPANYTVFVNSSRMGWSAFVSVLILAVLMPWRRTSPVFIETMTDGWWTASIISWCKNILVPMTKLYRMKAVALAVVKLVGRHQRPVHLNWPPAGTSALRCTRDCSVYEPVRKYNARCDDSDQRPLSTPTHGGHQPCIMNIFWAVVSTWERTASQKAPTRTYRRTG